MLCPYCLENTSPPVCGSCKETLPPLYVGRNSNPAILSAVGFSGHGKTVYLAMRLCRTQKQDRRLRSAGLAKAVPGRLVRMPRRRVSMTGAPRQVRSQDKAYRGRSPVRSATECCPGTVARN